MEIVGENLLPWPMYKPYFFLEKNNISGTSFKVYCLLCYPAKKVLSTSRCSASNLLRHMRKIHPNEVMKLPIMGPGYKKSVPIKRKAVDKDPQELSSASFQSITTETSTDISILPDSVIAEKQNFTFNEDFTTQHKVDQLVVDFVVNGLHSPAIVERPEFQNLIACLQPGKTIMTKITLENIISENANSFKRQLRDILSELTHVSTTADGWRVFNRCFIGVTVHWIDPGTLERRSAVLACKRIMAHTYIEIARVLDEVYEDYGIQNKIVQVTTDNGLNFAKACRVFRCDVKEEEEIEIVEQDFEFIELTPILDSENEEATLYNVPPHECCTAHTMYLLATIDTIKAEEDALYRDTMKEALSRCHSLWKMQSSSLQHAEFIKEKLGRFLPEPRDSHWSSQYEALKLLRQLFNDNMEVLNELCDNLDLPQFRDIDKIFIDEYCKVMKPIAAALDALQSENNAYMGILLPVLHALRRRLIHFRDQASNQDLLVVCYPLLEAVIDGLDKRFSNRMFRRDLVLASVLHPEFQLNWLKDEEKEAVAAECLKEAVKEISDDGENLEMPFEDEEDELFDFKKPRVLGRNDHKWETEVEQYLSFSTGQIKCLHSYPLIKDLFIQYNTAIPSSAAVEKTFSVIGDIFSQKGGLLTDTTAEDMLLIKNGIR